MPVGGDQPQRGQHARRLGDLIPGIRGDRLARLPLRARLSSPAFRGLPRGRADPGGPRWLVPRHWNHRARSSPSRRLAFTAAHISAKLYAV